MKLNVGVIGLGVGEAHVEAYTAHPNCMVTRICDFDKAKAEAVKRKFSGLSIAKHADDICKDPAIDVVSIASYDTYHADQIVKALNHGKHVFVEKPLCLNAAEAKRIRTALQKNPKLKLSSNLILRKCPRFIELRNWIRKGKLGEITNIEADYNYGRIHKITEGWRGKIDFYSVYFGGGIHMVDLILWFTGKKASEVTAYGNRIATKGTQFQYNDVVSSILKFEGGMIAKVASNYSCVYPHFHRLAVYGTKATYIHDTDGARLVTSRDKAVKPQAVKTAYPGHHKGDLIRGFVDSIVHKAKPEIGEKEVFECMSVCLAAETSMNSGKPVQVKYF